MNFKQSRRNRKLDSWIVILLLITFFLGTNYIISGINQSIDLTPQKKFRLSRESLALLNKMQSPVDIVITIRNDNDLPKIVQRLMLDLDFLLHNLQKEATKYPINVYRFNIDSPKDQFGHLQKYNISKDNAILLFAPSGRHKTLFQFQDKENPNPYDITEVFQSRDSFARQAVWQSEFYHEWEETGQGVLEPKLFRGEQVLLESILEIAGPKKEKNVVYFTRGHGEASPTDFNPSSGFSELRRMIEEANLSVTTIDLSTSESVPLDASFVVIAHPKGIFLDKEISSLRSYVNDQGGSLLISIDPIDEMSSFDRPVFGLRNILKEWGFRCHDMLVYDGNLQNYDYFSGAYYLSTYPKAKSHEIIRPLMEKEFSISASKCRPIESFSTVGTKFKSNELLFSSRDSFALSGWTKRNSPPQKNELLDIEGPVPIISVSETKSTKSRSKIAVLGCSDILSNRNLKRNSGNKFLTTNLLRWFSENEEFLNIQPNEVNHYTISMNGNDFSRLIYYSAFIPGLILFMGLFVSWLRKEL